MGKREFGDLPEGEEGSSAQIQSPSSGDMNQPQQLVWKVTPASRARPVDPAQWEQHRDELSNLYTNMTLEDLMAIMRVRHRFSPSKKQYVLQFEKWGLHKYDRVRPLEKPRVMRNSQFAIAATSPVSEIATPASVDMALKTPCPPGSKRVASHLPQIPPKKRQKLDRFMSVKALGDAGELDENVASAALRNLSKLDGQILGPFLDKEINIRSDDAEPVASNNRLPLPRTWSTECETERLINIKDGPITTPGAEPKCPYTKRTIGDCSCLQCAWDAKDDLLFSVTQQTPAVPFSEIETSIQRNLQRIIFAQGYTKSNSCPDWRPNSESVSLSFPTAHEQSTDCPQGLEVIDAAGEILTFSADDIQTIGLAADYLLGAHCYVEAFQLYLLVFRYSQTGTTTQTRQKEKARETSILGCARSAVIEPHVQIIQNILERDLASRPAYAVDTAKSFLFQSILSDFAWRRGDTETAMRHRNLACRSSLFEDRSFRCLSREDRSLDLITYQVLLKVIADTSFPPSLHSLSGQLILRQPGPFSYNGGSPQKTILRDCLGWFDSVLQPSKEFRKSWKNLTSLQTRNNQRTAYVAFYSDMWEHYRREEWPRSTHNWATNVESQMGISPTEMISCVCNMAMEAGPSELNRLDDNYPANFDVAAQTSVRRLMKLPDFKLAERFLDSFVGRKKLFQQARSEQQGAYNKLARDYIRAFIQETLHIALPPVVSDMEPSSSTTVTLAPFMAPQSDPGASGSGFLFPTLAPSLSSIGFASMEELRGRVDDSLETGMSRLSLEMPSAAMGNVSWKSKGSLVSGLSNWSHSLREVAWCHDVATTASVAAKGVSDLVMDQAAELSVGFEANYRSVRG